MLDLFLGAAYARERETQEKRATINALRKLPMPLLMKLASGEVKLGYGDCCPPMEGGPNKQNTWLTQFEGTPLQEQAVSLEQQDIALEMQEIQQRAQDRADREAKDSERDPIYDQRDQLRMQKKLLELQLQQSELTASAPASVDPQKKPPVPEAGNPGAGSMGPVAPSSDGELGSVGKTAAMDPSEEALQKQWEQYQSMHTPGQKIREGLSTLGGTVAGGALGAGVGYAGGALLNRLGVRGVTPGGLAARVGLGGGAFGMGLGSLVGGSHGQSDVDLGKAHERYADAEDQVYGPGIRKKTAATAGDLGITSISPHKSGVFMIGMKDGSMHAVPREAFPQFSGAHDEAFGAGGWGAHPSTKTAAQMGELLAKQAIIGPLADLAMGGGPSILGLPAGVIKGHSMATRGEPMDEASTGAALTVPGWTGYRVGKIVGHSLGSKGKEKAEPKEAEAKIALTLPNMQQLGSMAGQARSAIGGLAQKAAPVVQNAWGKLSPGAQKGLMLGAAGGAVEGGVRGLMGQEDHKLHPMGALTGALTGGTVGGAMGAGAGHLMGKYMPLGKI